MSLILYIAQFINPAHPISSANRQIRMKCRFHITNKLIYINLANMRALRSAVISRGYTNFPFPVPLLLFEEAQDVLVLLSCLDA